MRRAVLLWMLLASAAVAEETGFSPLLDHATDRAAFILHVMVASLNDGGDLKAVVMEDNNIERVARADVLEILKGDKGQARGGQAWFLWHESPPFPPRFRVGGEYLLFCAEESGGAWRGTDGKLHPCLMLVDPFLGIVPYDGLAAQCVRQRLGKAR